MTKGRLEAFSDAVIAIIMTVMVLELKAPTGSTFASLKPSLPTFLCFTLSFVYLGIYWSNHHHMFQAAKHVNGAVLWANLHLLFWLSIVPFATAWMGENVLGSGPVAFYGIMLLLAGIAYYILAQVLVALHGKDSTLGRAIGRDHKGRLSIVIYATAIGIAMWQPAIACVLYAVVAIMWLVPDRRVERSLVTEHSSGSDEPESD